LCAGKHLLALGFSDSPRVLAAIIKDAVPLKKLRNNVRIRVELIGGLPLASCSGGLIELVGEGR
jgi:hypothetical protein